MSALTALAERCERATGPDRALDADIAVEIRYFPKSVGFEWKHSLKANSPEVGRVECCTGEALGPHYVAPSFTSSIDTALKVGKMSDFVNLTRRKKGGFLVRHRLITDRDMSGLTAPLAICAAMLRGRALASARHVAL